MPELVGGSADLAPSTLTLIDGGGGVERGRLRRAQPPLRHPRARHGRDRQRPRRCTGFRAFGAGFLIFSDYMTGVDPAGRAHAASRRSSCSPTTRSASARTARPTSRSSSSRRCARCRTSTSSAPRTPTRPRRPGASRSTQTDAPDRARAHAPGPAGVGPGRRARRRDRARRLRAARDPSGEPDLILIGPGSEVHVANDARRSCSRPTASRVRRVACRAWTSSPRRTRPTATSVLPPAVRARVAVEAAATLGWHRWVGDAGDVVGIDGLRRLGAREALYEHFGFTGEASPRAARAECSSDAGVIESMSVTRRSTSASPRSPRPARASGSTRSAAADRERRARSGWSRRTRCAASPRTRRSSRRRSSAPTTTTSELAELAGEGLTRARDLPRRSRSSDVQLAADVLRPVYDATGGHDGYVSLEVAPRPRARHRRRRSRRRASTGSASTART